MNNEISLINNPKRTLSLAKHNFNKEISKFYISNRKEIINYNIFIVIFFSTYEILSYLYSVNYYINIYYYLYWFFLGILSTIGFGFGLHTGTFFLMPNLLNIYNKTSVEININIDNINLLVFIKTLPIVIAWGIGSAVGELPPYLLSKYSKEEYNSFYNKLNISPNYLEYIKKFSFGFITFLAAWPNITFDFIGVICGLNDISLFGFLLPTILGKAFIKAPIQSFFIIYFYSEINNYINVKSSFNNISTIINLVFIVIIFYFIKNLIESLAKSELNEKLI